MTKSKPRKYPRKKPDDGIVPLSPQLNWSPYQKVLFKEIGTGTQNLLVIARAGSSKTTSIVQGSKYIPKGKKALFCAFNVHIQAELRKRLGSYCDVMTLHSLGLRGIKHRFPNVQVDEYKAWKIVEGMVGSDYELVENLCRAVSMCKANLVDSPNKIEEVLGRYGIDLCELPLAQFVGFVVKALRLCKEQTTSVDFDDMVWFCFVYRINVGKYDFVFVDEAQDLNKAQIELAFSACKIDGRTIVVMDNFQALYSWRGADDQVLDNFRTRLNPKELMLPICYRCPKKVVALCQTIVSDIVPFENSPEGEIEYLTTDKLQHTAKAGSYVLSRTNAPLIKTCLRFLKSGVPANILGRDIGDGLLYLIKKSKKRTVSDLLKWLITWEDNEKKNLLTKYPKASTENITDRADCLRMLCEDTADLNEVKENIAELFGDGEEKNIVLFSTVHRIKGKEADEVFVLTDTLRMGSQEEANICYVAYSRAKKKLYLVSKLPVPEDERFNS